jgi:N-acetylglucosaminyldiphosphoundecaprenol N-acetyl-beta-D-mannosaminyltransferase
MSPHSNIFDTSREVYCLLGIPVDATTMDGLVDRIASAAKERKRFFVSTPNLNFVVTAQNDRAFRKSLIESDFCPADGAGVLLLCRLLGLHRIRRVAGSDIPRALRESKNNLLDRPFHMMLLGGAPGVAEKACAAVNAAPGQLRCVGALDPGTVTLSDDGGCVHIAAINKTRSDILLVALGAQKGQAWIMQNLASLETPVVSHLGATINFLAGTVQRAPRVFQKLGLEWLWRIKEEPHLAARYWNDGVTMLKLIFGRVLPLRRWLRRHGKGNVALDIEERNHSDGAHTFLLSGYACGSDIEKVSAAFSRLSQVNSVINLDFRNLQGFDLAFAGQILLLEKASCLNRFRLGLVNSPPHIKQGLVLCGLGHLVR